MSTQPSLIIKKKKKKVSLTLELLSHDDRLDQLPPAVGAVNNALESK